MNLPLRPRLLKLLLAPSASHSEWNITIFQNYFQVPNQEQSENIDSILDQCKFEVIPAEAQVICRQSHLGKVSKYQECSSHRNSELPKLRAPKGSIDINWERMAQNILFSKNVHHREACNQYIKEHTMNDKIILPLRLPHNINQTLSFSIGFLQSKQKKKKTEKRA